MSDEKFATALTECRDQLVREVRDPYTALATVLISMEKLHGEVQDALRAKGPSGLHNIALDEATGFWVAELPPDFKAEAGEILVFRVAGEEEGDGVRLKIPGEEDGRECNCPGDCDFGHRSISAKDK